MTRRKFQGAKRTDRPATKPSARVERATEAELRLETLLRKMDAWLRQQPDWVFLLAQDRHTRRKVGTAVAGLLTRMPQRQAPSGLAPGQVLDIEAPHARLENEKEVRDALADAYMDELEREEEVGSGEDKPNHQGAVASPVGSHAPESAPKDQWGEWAAQKQDELHSDPEGDEKARLYPDELGGEG
jgi:hypothetical protein